ncbi:hypothetical protein KIW84_022907 [Lathyrus oleraceus]|uniref:Uncharacterized protein n=1 Tax=Pisum sativum TaxID=3888 RepID=A0A9D4YBK8_PEA|nr:hypothetical protein KIW84_022907 [Pisum sativum]
MATGGKRDAKNLAIKCIVRWPDLQLVLHPLLKVFLRILSPRHSFNKNWNTSGSCDNIIPLSNGNEASQVGSSDPVIEGALKIYKNPIPQPVETFTVAKCPIKVVGAHVTLSGDLKNQFEETNVGFDTSCKARAEQDKYHGVILLLEGLVESIPEIYALLKEIHVLLQQGVAADKIFVHLSPWASALVEFLPPFIRRQLLLYTEPDDSTQSSQIEPETSCIPCRSRDKQVSEKKAHRKEIEDSGKFIYNIKLSARNLSNDCHNASVSELDATNAIPFCSSIIHNPA